MAPCPPQLEDYIPRRPRTSLDDDINEFRGFNFLENHTIPNDDVFRMFDLVRRVNVGADGVNSVVNNEDFIGYKLFPYSLELIKQVLFSGLYDFFDELEANVVSCPYLNIPPYNLAACGLSGNTSYLRFGGTYNLQNSDTVLTCDIGDELLRYNHDSFIIGTGYATQPSMPYNGIFTMNATVLPPEIGNNNSRIVYKDDTDRLQVKKMTDSNQMVCSMMGNFFFSEGRRGKVIKMRAKGGKTDYNIVVLIQMALLLWNSRNSVVLGGVFLINGGILKCYSPVKNYRMHLDSEEFSTWMKRYLCYCKNLVAIGALTNSKFEHMEQMPDGHIVLKSRYSFHIFSDEDGPHGLFANDITPEDTEYICYFNIAETAYL